MGLKTSTMQPDSKPQVGLFDPSLKNERKSMFKMVLIVSSYQHVTQRSSSLQVFLPHHRLRIHTSAK